jgi:hypothetical protein
MQLAIPSAVGLESNRVSTGEPQINRQKEEGGIGAKNVSPAQELGSIPSLGFAMNSLGSCPRVLFHTGFQPLNQYYHDLG